MGCCYSCKEDSSSQGGEPNERSALLADPVSNTYPSIQRVHSDDLEAVYPNSLPKKADEQSALNRILQEAASNVIDVAAMGAHNLQQHEYMERVNHYSLKLQGVQPNRHAPVRRPPCLLVDIPAPDKMLATNPQTTDIFLIMSMCDAATTALTELKVEHKEDLVVPFRIP